MKEGQFLRMNADSAGKDAPQNVERAFKDDDFVTQEQIYDFADDLYARHVAGMKQLAKDKNLSKNQVMLLVDAMSEDRIYKMIVRPEKQSDGVYRSVADELFKDENRDLAFDDERKGKLSSGLTFDDVKPMISRIRKAILFRLGSHMEPGEFAMVKKTLKEGSLGDIKELEQSGSQDNLILRQAGDLKLNSESLKKMLRKASKGNKDALKMLEKGRGAPDSLLVPRLIAEGEKGGDMIMEKMRLETMTDKMFDKGVPTYKLLQYWQQMLDLTIDLESQGVMMRDLKTDNVEIDVETDQVVVVDLDGLFPIGTKQITMYSEGYDLPEFERGDPKTSADEMTYQMGRMLTEVYDTRFDDIHKSGLVADMILLIREMTKKKPKDRISLQEARDRINEFEKTALGFADTMVDIAEHPEFEYAPTGGYTGEESTELSVGGYTGDEYTELSSGFYTGDEGTEISSSNLGVQETKVPNQVETVIGHKHKPVRFGVPSTDIGHYDTQLPEDDDIAQAA